jgi:hypothetical protein
MSLPAYVIVVIVVVALVVIGVLTIVVLACLGVRWCWKLAKKPKKQPYAVPPGFSLQRLETIRVDPPEKTAADNAQIAAENAFLDTLPGLPPRYVIPLSSPWTPQFDSLLEQLNIILLSYILQGKIPI